MPSTNLLNEFASDVRSGLTKRQKELHSKYFYDELGSSLFEAITHLPEYGLTRADERLLCRHAHDIARSITAPVAVIELGSGMGQKTRNVLEALRPANPHLRFFPIDVSPDALARCQRGLADVASVHPFEQSYLHGLSGAVAERHHDEKLLVLFLGSNIGNFERPCATEFLREVRQNLRPGDAVLIGADLVKEPERMLLAYDDPTGLTAAFNLNILGRINRELGGNFNLREFQHEAHWNQQERRIEMHLRSRFDQTVEIAHAGSFRFATAETIWTESSHKFEIPELFQMSMETGFQIAVHWIDPEWPFVESLWIAH